MQLLRNRTLLGIGCIAISLLIAFVLSPLLNGAMSDTTYIVRVSQDISQGSVITSQMVEEVEVGSFNLPDAVIHQVDTVVGQFATADLTAGDYILPSKLSATPPLENQDFYTLDGSQQAVSVSISSLATGLSGQLMAGDIVSIIAPDYLLSGNTVIPPELTYLKVIAVTTASGVPAHSDSAEEELPATVTLLCTPEQSLQLAQLEAEGILHFALVYRGDDKTAQGFLDAQAELLATLYPPMEEGTEEVIASEVEPTEEDEVTP